MIDHGTKCDGQPCICWDENCRPTIPTKTGGVDWEMVAEQSKLAAQTQHGCGCTEEEVKAGCKIHEWRAKQQIKLGELNPDQNRMDWYESQPKDGQQAKNDPGGIRREPLYQQIYATVLSHAGGCTCHPAYSERNLEDPDCTHCRVGVEELSEELTRLLSQPNPYCGCTALGPCRYHGGPVEYTRP